MIALVEKIIALGGVAIGIINAQLAAITTGSAKIIESSWLDTAKAIMIGRNNNVVAVLLVTSVKKEIKSAIKIIIRNR